ncbi:unnamed protein product, partial [Pocillopora meandrina]
YLHRRSCVALGGTGCEGNNAKCCRKGNPYTGTMRSCVNTGSFSGPRKKFATKGGEIHQCYLLRVKSINEGIYKRMNYLHRRACVPLGRKGCEGNNGKCCRKGNPYTGTMRKCKNTGSFSSPGRLLISSKRNALKSSRKLKHLHRRSCIPVGQTGCAKNDGNCCRKGNPFTGVKRKCVNKGSFFAP